jgi:putative lipoprotein (rSAM/lipoprotein system)
MKNKFLLGLLALLGFSGCEFMAGDGDDNGDGGGTFMYAPLRVGFVVKGAVTDADDKPLENIRIVLKLRDDETDENLIGAQSLRDTVYTDAKGEFRTEERPDISTVWTLTATDIDGAENGGEFNSEEKQFNIQDNFDYDEGLYVNEINFTLTKKTDSDENE